MTVWASFENTSEHDVGAAASCLGKTDTGRGEIKGNIEENDDGSWKSPLLRPWDETTGNKNRCYVAKTGDMNFGNLFEGAFRLDAETDYKQHRLEFSPTRLQAALAAGLFQGTPRAGLKSGLRTQNGPKVSVWRLLARHRAVLHQILTTARDLFRSFFWLIDRGQQELAIQAMYMRTCRSVCIGIIQSTIKVPAGQKVMGKSVNDFNWGRRTAKRWLGDFAIGTHQSCAHEIQVECVED